MYFRKIFIKKEELKILNLLCINVSTIFIKKEIKILNFIVITCLRFNPYI